MQLYKAIRAALGACYLGDTSLAKAMFSSPQTFDDRVLSLLTGLGQGVDAPAATAISGADLKAVMAALDSTSNSLRVSILTKLKNVSYNGRERFGFLDSDPLLPSAAIGANSSPLSVSSKITLVRISQYCWSIDFRALASSNATIAAPCSFNTVVTPVLAPLLYEFCFQHKSLGPYHPIPCFHGTYSYSKIPILLYLDTIENGSDNLLLNISCNANYILSEYPACSFSATVDFTP